MNDSGNNIQNNVDNVDSSKRGFITKTAAIPYLVLIGEKAGSPAGQYIKIIIESFIILLFHCVILFIHSTFQYAV